MIPLDRLQAVNHVVVHENCPDGVASALILKDAIPSARVSFMSYGSREHRTLAPEPGILFCDFTPYSVWQDGGGSFVEGWTAVGALVLDHHPSAADLVSRFVSNDLGVFGLNEKNECGAWLAYEHVWKRFAEEYDLSDDVGRAQVRHFAELAAVRDTWKTADPRWAEACELSELLLFWRAARPLSYYVDPAGAAARAELAAHLVGQKLAAARKSIDEAHHFITMAHGTRVLMFQGVAATSDAAEMVEKEGVSHPLKMTHPDGTTEQGTAWTTVDLIVGFHYGVDAGKLKLQFSMRSHTGYDVGAFAKSKPGGGGHAAAAGFTVEISSPELSSGPYAMFAALLSEWETGR